MSYPISDMIRSPSAHFLLLAVVSRHLQAAGGARLNAASRGSSAPVPRSLAGASSSRLASSSLEAIADDLGAQSLQGSVSSVLRDMRALAHVGPEWIASWAKTMPRCVSSVNATLLKLERDYGKPQVPSVLVHACDSPKVFRDIGGARPACTMLMNDLGRVYGACGDQNYYTWCRNLYLNSSTIVKEKQRQYMNNSNISANKRACDEACPEISSIITDLNVFMQILDDFHGLYMSLVMGDKTSSIDLMVEQVELLFRLDNRMCDNVHFAKIPCARPSLMPESCRGLEEEMQLGPVHDPGEGGVVQFRFDECDRRQPCRDACQGIDAKRVDYFAAALRASTKAVPTYADGKAICDSIPHLQECAAQPSCTEYMSHQWLQISNESLKEQWNLGCRDVFLDGCYQLQEKKCWREIEVLNKPFKNKTANCRDVLADAWAYTDEEVSACCQASLNLAHCNRKNWCHGFMEKEIEFTKLGEQFESLCPQVLWALTTTTTPSPFDCDAGLVNWERGWSTEKKEWCCNNEVKGCGLFDCQAGLTNWQRGWSDEKKVWCCTNDGVGCTTTPPPDMFDCHEGLNNWKRGWSRLKKDWCCSNRNLGCPGQPSPGVGHKSPLV